MKLKKTILFVSVALVHAAGLAALALPRTSAPDSEPILLSVAPLVAEEPQPNIAPQPQPQPKTPHDQVPKQAPTQSVAPIKAESLIPDSAPVVSEMVVAKVESVKQVEAAPPAAVNPQPVIETQPSFHADYLKNPEPTYPRQSQALGEEGRVVLRVQVNEAGEPTQVEIFKSSGFPRLDEAARRTVEGRWHFAPARRGNQAVTGVVQVPISFAIRG